MQSYVLKYNLFLLSLVCSVENPSPYPHMLLWARCEGGSDQEGAA